jgi:hypothetical protein
MYDTVGFDKWDKKGGVSKSISTKIDQRRAFLRVVVLYHAYVHVGPAITVLQCMKKAIQRTPEEPKCTVSYTTYASKVCAVCDSSHSLLTPPIEEMLQ